MNMNKNTKIIIGIAVAAGIGIAIAALLAPEKTTDFRKKITSSLDDLGQKVAELLGEEKQHSLADNGKQNLWPHKDLNTGQGKWTRKTTF